MVQNTVSILINQLSFLLPNGHLLFDQLQLAFSKQKTGLVGKNGVGKSTLLKLIMRELSPHKGTVKTQGILAYVPQTLNLVAKLTLSEFWGITPNRQALLRSSEHKLEAKTIADYWVDEPHIQASLRTFGLPMLSLDCSINSLSGGELTRLSLAKAFNSGADFLLLDEPTNHLDAQVRHQLYENIRTWSGGLLIASHDRNLLNFMEQILELNSLGYHFYGGNFEVYHAQKTIEKQAVQHDLKDAKKSMKNVKRKIQATHKKQAKTQAQGKKRWQSGGQPKLMLGTQKNRSEQSLNTLDLLQK